MIISSYFLDGENILELKNIQIVLKIQYIYQETLEYNNMIEFQSLYSIINDILFTVRGSVVVESETISQWQIEYWVHLYRALLLKQDLDKGKFPNPDYIQEIQGLHLSPVQTTEMENLFVNKYVLKSDLQIPNTIDLNFDSGLMYVGGMNGTEIQLIPQGRAVWQEYKYYTNKTPIAYLKNRYLYVVNGDTINYLTIRGVFEIPTEVSLFINPITGLPSYNVQTDKYPMPSDKITVLKQMILSKEFQVMLNSPSDIKNDSENNLLHSDVSKAQRER
jgi:hypothetical protein